MTDIEYALYYARPEPYTTIMLSGYVRNCLYAYVSATPDLGRKAANALDLI